MKDVWRSQDQLHLQLPSNWQWQLVGQLHIIVA
jgi:hypothetical protein